MKTYRIHILSADTLEKDRCTLVGIVYMEIMSKTIWIWTHDGVAIDTGDETLIDRILGRCNQYGLRVEVK